MASVLHPMQGCGVVRRWGPGFCSPSPIPSLQITRHQSLDLAVALEPNATFLKKSLQVALRHVAR